MLFNLYLPVRLSVLPVPILDTQLLQWALHANQTSYSSQRLLVGLLLPQKCSAILCTWQGVVLGRSHSLQGVDHRSKLAAFVLLEAHLLR